MKRFMGLLAAVVIACTESSGPIDPPWTSYACDHCRMTLAEREFAGQVLTSDGQHRYFDDIGCMLSYMREHRAKTSWVYHNGQWLEAGDAHYADGARTPMGSGYHVIDAGGFDFATMRDAYAARSGQ